MRTKIVLVLVIVATVMLMPLFPQSLGQVQNSNNSNDFNYLSVNDNSYGLRGLEAPVTIIQDSNGVYHIYAQNNHDLFYALGFVQAENRLFQMELFAMEGMGNLSSILGPAYNAYDQFQTMTGAPFTAINDWNSVLANATANATDNETVVALESYAQGINAYINFSIANNALPFMYQLLGIMPFYWNPVYSYAVQEVMAQSLAFGNDAVKESLIYYLMGNETNALIPPFSPVQSYYYAGYSGSPNPYVLKMSEHYYPINRTVASMAAQLISEFDPLTVISKNPDLNMGYWLPRGHSNEWVVAGNRTATGYPILVGGPVLSFSLPSIWFQVQLVDPEYDVYGVVLPGAPTIIIGFNNNIAWTLTDVQAISSQTYYFLQQVRNGEYLWNSTWYPVKQYSLNGFTVNFTNLGPIMVENGSLALVMFWIGNMFSNDFGVFLNIMKATNWNEFYSALSNWNVPFQNFAFASKSDIGDVSAGLYPIFNSSSGLPYTPNAIMPGNGEEYLSGFIPYSQIPHVLDPKAGFFVSSNQRQVGPAYPYWFGNTITPSPGYRAQMEVNYLSTHTNVTITDMEMLQLRNYTDYEAQVAVPIMLKYISDMNNATIKNAVNIFTSWDYNMSPNSRAASLWFFTYEFLFNNTFIPYLEEKGWLPEYASVLGIPSGMGGSMPNTTGYSFMDIDMLNILIKGNAEPFSNENISTLISNAVFKAMNYLYSLYPNGNFTWGNFMGFMFPNLYGITAYNVGPVIEGGDYNTPNDAGGVNPYYPAGGQSWVMVANMANISDSFGVYPGGQSDNPMSPLYANYVQDWANADYLHLLFVPSVQTFPLYQEMSIMNITPENMTVTVYAINHAYLYHGHASAVNPNVTFPSGNFSRIAVTFENFYVSNPWDYSYYVSVNDTQILSGNTYEMENTTVTENVTQYYSIIAGQITSVSTFGAQWEPGYSAYVSVWFTFYYGAQAVHPNYVVPVFNHIGIYTPKNAYPNNVLIPFNTTVSKNVTFPGNVESGYINLYALQNGNDEGWYANQPPFREFIISVDNEIIAEIQPYPNIQTGGWDLFLWQPITAIGAILDPPYTVSITPYVSLLNGTKEVNLTVINNEDQWIQVGLNFMLNVSSVPVSATTVVSNFTSMTKYVQVPPTNMSTESIPSSALWLNDSEIVHTAQESYGIVNVQGYNARDYVNETTYFNGWSYMFDPNFNYVVPYGNDYLLIYNQTFQSKQMINYSETVIISNGSYLTKRVLDVSSVYLVNMYFVYDLVLAPNGTLLDIILQDNMVQQKYVSSTLNTQIYENGNYYDYVFTNINNTIVSGTGSFMGIIKNGVITSLAYNHAATSLVQYVSNSYYSSQIVNNVGSFRTGSSGYTLIENAVNNSTVSRNGVITYYYFESY